MVLLAAGSPLVAGGAVSEMKTQTIKVVRAFFVDGKVQPVGAVIDVPAWVAAEAVYCGKAVRTEKPAVVETVPEAPPPEVIGEPIRKRGKKDAG
jgi:hypothetical protein